MISGNSKGCHSGIGRNPCFKIYGSRIYIRKQQVYARDDATELLWKSINDSRV